MASSDRQAELDRVHERIRQCNDCGLCTNITNYVPGEGPADAQIMLVGEAPGAQEDKQGRPFVGPSGSLLTRLLHSIGIDRKDVFITSVVKCRPPGNRAPTASELAACRQHLGIVAPGLGGVLVRVRNDIELQTGVPSESLKAPTQPLFAHSDPAGPMITRSSTISGGILMK